MEISYEYRIAGTTTWIPANKRDIVGAALKIKYTTNEGSHYKYSGTGDITILGDFYQFIKTNIWDSPTGNLIKIEVRIKVVKCNKYLPIYQVDAGNLKYCDGDCYFKVTLKSDSDLLSKVRQYVPYSISIPINFRYCEDRSIVGYLVFVVILTMLELTGVGAIIIAVAAGILGSVFVDLFRQIRGCNFKQYGFRLREILTRLGTQTGLIYNATTDDLFFTKYPNHSITYYGKSETQNYNLFLPNIHNPNLNGYEYLELIKESYSAKYRLDLGQIRIKERYTNWNATPIDFTDERFCYELTDYETAALHQFEHKTDQLDGTGSDANQYDDLIDVNSPTPNTLQKGVIRYDFPFARQRFRCDGVKEDKLDKVDSNTLFQAILGILDAVTPLDLLEDRTYFLNDSNNGVGVVRIVDYDAATPRENAKVVRIPFTPAIDSYYTSIGLTGEDPDSIFLYGTIRNTVCNASVFTNQTLNSIATLNRIREFENDFPQSTIQLGKKNKLATVTINACTCADLDLFGIFEGQEAAIDFYATTQAGGGEITEFEIDFNNGTIKIVIKI